MMALMAIFAVTTAFADDDEFKVVEGSFVDVVRQPGKTATVRALERGEKAQPENRGWQKC